MRAIRAGGDRLDARRTDGDARMNVLVLMGGLSAEREISLRTGSGIVAALERRGHRVLAGDPATGRLARGVAQLEAAAAPPAAAGAPAALPSTAGPAAAHAALAHGGLVLADRTQALLTAQEAAGVDVVLIALHGGAGEDGTLQTLLELAHRPYTGSGPLASALAMDKVMAKRLFAWAGIPTPEWVDMTAAEASAVAEALAPASAGAWTAPPEFAALGLPLVVKPVDQGSTIGLTIVQRWEDLAGAVTEAGRFGPRILFERFIPGRELAIGVLGRDVLPIVEIEPTHAVYDYACKYTKGMSRYICPAKIDPTVARAAQKAALGAFEVLGCADFGRVDVRLTPDGQPYVLEVNTIPGMTETSLLPMAAAEAGIPYDALVERMCQLALARRAATAGNHPGPSAAGRRSGHAPDAEADALGRTG
jgi:D-alanine-D-alanine ligase